MTDIRQTLIRPERTSAVSGNLLGMTSMMAWAAGFPAAEALLQTWDPVPLVAGRVLFAMILLLPLWLILDPGGLRRPGNLRGMAVGAFGFGGGALTILVAQWYTDPVTVAIIAAASPLTATLVEWAHDRTPLTRPFLIGLVLTVIGGAVATGGGVPGNLGIGAALALASCFLFSWASLRTIRDLPDHGALGRTTVTLAGALVLLWAVLAVGLASGFTPPPPDPLSGRSLGLLAVYGLGAMAISQFLWIASVDKLGVAVASFHINLSPFYVMLLMLVLGGSWSWSQAIGAAIVGSGVVIAQRPARTQP